MAIQRFHAIIKLRGINPYVLVSRTRARAIKAGWRRPIPVRIRVNGEPKVSPWQINMMPVGDGSFYPYLHSDVRRASSTKVGDRVRIKVEFDANYSGGPSKTMPTWLRSALSRNVKALAGWRALTPSRQKEIARYLAGLKSSDARERNLAKVITMLAPRRAGAVDDARKEPRESNPPRRDA